MVNDTVKQINNTTEVFIAFLILGLVGLLFLLVFGNLGGVLTSTSTTFLSNQQEFIASFNIPQQLDKVGLISLIATRYNTTWLDQDGVDDFIDYSSVGSLGESQTWWAKNSTESNWHFYVNASNTHYVDGVVGTINEFIFNGTQTNTTFAGSIDSIRIYNLNLTSEDVLFLNSLGR